MTLNDLKKERDVLRAEFDAAGGRGVELADEIDEIEAKIEVLEHPLKLKEAIEIVLKIADRHIDEQDYPDDESIADTEAMRRAYIDHAVAKVHSYLKGTVTQ
jgi:hypothetical protein